MSADKINAQLRQVFPELLSEFAKYPLELENWTKPDGTINSNPAFLKEPDVGPKPDYVYGPGPMGRGYYHLTTREAYKILYARCTNEMPFACCCLGAPRDLVDAWDTTKRICYNRSVATKPNDAIAAEDAIKIARGEAQGHYYFNQI